MYPASTVNITEITPFLNKAEAYMSMEEAESFAQSLRQKGKKIIFTNLIDIGLFC